MMDSLLCPQGAAGQAKSHPDYYADTPENQGARGFYGTCFRGLRKLRSLLHFAVIVRAEKVQPQAFGFLWNDTASRFSACPDLDQSR
jgi:hypothetical protein